MLLLKEGGVNMGENEFRKARHGLHCPVASSKRLYGWPSCKAFVARPGMISEKLEDAALHVFGLIESSSNVFIENNGR